MKKIVYMGTPHYAKVILEALVESEEFEVVLVITQPDRPVGRKKTLTPPPVKELAVANNIELLQPNRLSDEGVKEAIEQSRPDFIVVAAFGQLLPKEILDIAPCINLHASILPKYRGASPIQQALLNGDSQTGVTAMLMDVGLDTGDILKIERCEIQSDTTQEELFERLTDIAAKLTLETLRLFDALEPKKQDEHLASHCKKIKKEDGLVELEDATVLYNRYRAFKGWPGLFCADGLKFDNLELVDGESLNRAGEILEISKNKIVVGCTKGAVAIKTIQPPSKKPTDAKAYCANKGLGVGDLLI